MHLPSKRQKSRLERLGGLTPSASRGDRARRVRTIHARLVEAYGPQPWEVSGEPVEELVATILSQNTSDTNSGAAYEELTRRFRDWDQAADAPPRQVADAIRSGGLAEQKTRTIQAALRTIRRDFGSITLEPLASWEPQRAMGYLTGMPGVGPKTAACVLMFALGLPVFPVDTHIHRVSIRLGLAPAKASVVRTQQILQQACPPKLVYSFHVLTITHGRRTCKAQRPRCADCVLKDICPSALTFQPNNARADKGARGTQANLEGARPSKDVKGSDPFPLPC